MEASIGFGLMVGPPMGGGLFMVSKARTGGGFNYLLMKP